jgi:hypothetical protein
MGSRAVAATLAGLTGLLGLGSAAVQTEEGSAPPAGVSLTGRWSLDPDRSDDPRLKVKEAMAGVPSDDSGPVRRPPSPGPGGMPRDPRDDGAPAGPGVDIMTPGMTGAGVSDDPFRTGSSGSGRSDPRAAYEYVLDLPKTLTIAQRSSLILIQENDDEGRTRGLHPDGSRRQSPGGKSATRTRWEKGRLHVETWRGDGVDVDEVFEIAPDKSQLTVVVRVAQGGVGMTLERVFVPVPPEEG